MAIIINVHGHVQGVFFRDFILKKALFLGLAGYVQNILEDESVKIYAEGTEDKLKQLMKFARTGPPAAKVANLEITWGNHTENMTSFEIRL